MKKITLTEVRKAYKDTGLTPVDGVTLTHDDSNCCCPIAALYFNSHKRDLKKFKSKDYDDMLRPLFKWADAKYDKDYVDGFINGFDGNKLEDLDNKEFAIGHKEGSTVRKIIDEKHT